MESELHLFAHLDCPEELLNSIKEIISDATFPPHPNPLPRGEREKTYILEARTKQVKVEKIGCLY